MTAFHHLLASHYPRVHRAALGMLRDEQDAREIAQEALLRAYKARKLYDPARPFYPWLRRIVRNACLDAIARRARRPRCCLASSPSPPSAGAWRAPRPTPTPR